MVWLLLSWTAQNRPVKLLLEPDEASRRTARHVDERTRAAAALEALYELPVVPARLDGTQALIALELDVVEHDRRAALGAGAVDSLSLLHGLWMLPAGGTVDVASVPDVKLRALRDAVHHVSVIDSERLARTYSPAGVVRAVGFVGRSVERAIRRAARFTPIVERVVLVEPGVVVAGRAAREALEWGVGLVDTEQGELVVPGLQAVKGVPAVYRWWLAELAYAGLLHENAQPVS